jgi:hypothetical protein
MRGLVPFPIVLLAALAVPTSVVHTQSGAAAGAQVPTGRAGGAVPNLTAAEPMGPVENLTAYPVPPEGFNVARDNIAHGEVKLVEYDSKTLGIRRPLRVYTPPGYSTARKYPVLYLQHGLGNTSTEWVQRARTPDHRRQPDRRRQDAADDHRLSQRQLRPRPRRTKSRATAPKRPMGRPIRTIC